MYLNMKITISEKKVTKVLTLTLVIRQKNENTVKIKRNENDLHREGGEKPLPPLKIKYLYIHMYTSSQKQVLRDSS